MSSSAVPQPFGPYRLIAIDLDGTLLSPQGSVTPRTKTAVQACLSAGLLVCFATGRNWTESRSVIDAVGHYGSAVFVGGAIVIDTGSRVTLHRTLMRPALANDLCRFFEGQGHAAMALQDTATAGVDYLTSADLPLDASMAVWLTATGATARPTPELSDHDHAHTVRVGVVAPPAESARMIPLLDNQFGDRIFYHSIKVSTFNVEVLEVFDPAVNKWQGVLHVAKHHGVDPAHVVAIGDDVNDLPMIRGAGLGVAMGQARPEIRAAAKMVIGSNADDGLAEFLERLVADHAVTPP